MALLSFDKDTGMQHALLTFRVAGTYAQADDAELTGIPTLISESRRNGKTVTLIDAMRGIPASKAASAIQTMSLKSVTVAGDDVTFELTDGDETTELANGSVPQQDRPFSVVVAFTEA